MKSKVCLLFFLIFSLNVASLAAQYVGSSGDGEIMFDVLALRLDGENLNVIIGGGVGRGDKGDISYSQSLSGENLCLLFAGGSGRGDHLFDKANIALDGEYLHHLFAGGSGRGDNLVSNPSGGLNGENLNHLYTGGVGRGENLIANSALSLEGDDLGLIFIGGEGRGDHQYENRNIVLNGEDTGILFVGGPGRGDDLVTASGEIIHCTYYSIWTGTESTAWENPANWQCGELPHRFSDVLIPTTVPNFPFITVSPVEIRNLTMDNSSMLHVIGVPLNVLGGDQ